MQLNRRNFMKVGLSSMAYFTLEATTPNWIIRSANALGTGDCLKDDRILVIIQLAGGNDGLNTIIPRTDPLYYAARPRISIPNASQVTLDSLNGMHPAMSRLGDWYQDGHFAVINNVGYVNPNLSHFSSTQYFEEGYVPGMTRPRIGWAAKLYDSACGCNPPDTALFYMGSGVGRIPKTLHGAPCYTPPAVLDPESYRLYADTDESLRLPTIESLNTIPTVDPDIDFLQRSENALEASIDDIAIAANTAHLVPETDYSSDRLGQGLKLASQVIRAGFKTRIFYVSQGGYDTHANQIIPGMDALERGNHPRLLSSFSNSVDAFLREMEMSGNLERVLIMTFSEFGRRVEENASLGTDHGAANSLMVFGGSIAPGIYGGQPNLADLVRGNLRHTVDFRSVYSLVIEQWLRCDPVPVFGQSAYDSIIVPDYPEIPFLDLASAVTSSSWNSYR